MIQVKKIAHDKFASPITFRLNRPFDVYIDESTLLFEQILVSGGQRGVDLQLRVSDLLHVTQAQPVRATHPTSSKEIPHDTDRF